MSKKAFLGFLAFVIVLILVAAAWCIGWKITGEMNPVKWGQSQTDKTEPEKGNEGEEENGGETDPEQGGEENDDENSTLAVDTYVFIT